MIKRLKNLLIPHKGNNFRPDFLERVSVGIMLVLILLSFAIANMQALFWISSDWLVSTILPAVIADLTNDERMAEHVSSLRRSDILDKAAAMKAKDMVESGYFSHYSPSGVSPWHWFDTVGYDYLHAGENLAVHFTESNKVVQAWMDSPTHRANIMNGAYTEIGVGSAKGIYNGRSTIFVVQLFGTERIQTQITSRVVDTTETVSSQVTADTIAGASTSDTPNELPIGNESLNDIPMERSETQVISPVLASDIPSELYVDDAVRVYTSLATTSRDGEPAPVSAMIDNDLSQKSVSLPLRGATSASLWLESLYAILAFLVIASLVTSLAIEWKRHHPIQIAYAGGLLAVMALLLFIHTSLTGTILIV